MCYVFQELITYPLSLISNSNVDIFYHFQSVSQKHIILPLNFNITRFFKEIFRNTSGFFVQTILRVLKFIQK
jgi:hypothetical protein